jgi:hypothetical protein
MGFQIIEKYRDYEGLKIIFIQWDSIPQLFLTLAKINGIRRN